jgi:hypothetical protein
MDWVICHDFVLIHTAFTVKGCIIKNKEQLGCGPPQPFSVSFFPKIIMKLKGKRFNNVLQVQHNLHQVHTGTKVKVKK